MNYGEAEDYDKVIANGVEVKDKIVLVKYGGKTPEPNKVYIAEQHKAKAVVFITKKYSVSDDVIQRECWVDTNVAWRYFDPWLGIGEHVCD